MPARATWLLRVPEILRELSALEAPVLDRAAFERLFGVRRRRAIQLLDSFGGYQAGRTFLVDRQELIGQLAGIGQGGEFRQERRRRLRLAETLDNLRRLRQAAEVRIPAGEEAWQRRLQNLPAGIHLQPGLLQIEFDRPLDLLTKLFELSQAISNDFEKFEREAGGNLLSHPPLPGS